MQRLILAATLPMLLATVVATGLGAQSLSGYREFVLGATTASVAATAQVPTSAFRTLYEKPVRLQEFEWRPSHYAGSDVRTDSVEQITFSFYDDQLWRMVVAYDSRRTAGMTSADLTAALTTVYGTPAAARESSEDPELGPRVARWQNSTESVELFRGSDAWRLVLASRELQAAARAATARAVRVEQQEAPAREREQRKQDEAAERAREEQTRRANKATFQP
jgi:hypothetical protein